MITSLASTQLHLCCRMSSTDLLQNAQNLFSSLSVFVNKSVTLENIKCYGFDMDYTMAGA